MLLIDKRWKRFLCLAASGALSALTLVCPQIGFIEWLTLIPLGVFLLGYADSDRVRGIGMYGWGFFFFMCYYTVSFHWFINLYPLEFIDGMTAWAALAVVIAGCVGLSALQAFFGGFMFVTVRYLFRTSFMQKHMCLRPLAIGFLWAIYEWSQNIGWWGVPWARLPIGQSEYIVGLQTASLFGSYFVTFLIVFVNMCAAYALLCRSRLRLMSICALCALVFNFGVGTLLYFLPVDNEQTVRLAAVQGNISSNEKWTLESADRTFEVYEEYTLAAAEQGAQIVVWPETALPYEIAADNFKGRYCSELAKKANTTILVGGFYYQDEECYNAIITVLPSGEFHDNIYQKQRLVPFGEFVPLREVFELLIPPLAELVMSSEDVSAGEDSRVTHMEGLSIGSLICFDSIYDSLARESVRDGAQIIALSTNDSWFTDSAALRMHNAQAQMRAIENGRYVVRAANTGISTVINSKGEVISELCALVDGMLVEDVHVNTHRTLYSYIGNSILAVFAIALVLPFAAEIKERIHKKANKNRTPEAEKIGADT